MMKTVFAPGGLVWRILNALTDVLFLSLLWLLCCIPVVTAGSATTALYDCAVRCIRYRVPRPYRRFVNTFRTTLKITIPTTLIWLAVCGLCVLIYNYFVYLTGFMENAFAAGASLYVAMIIPVGAMAWVFPILSRFTFDFRSLNGTALKFAVGHLPSTIVIVLLIIESAKLSVQYILPIIFAPACIALLASLFIEPVFAKYGGGLTRHVGPADDYIDDAPSAGTDDERSEDA